jgi:diaminohydroxyphosphoribosylaminopyrimidine deaminase / 5-amino-6-(5-phosphoribosylamino)uracil reductase
MVSNELDRQRLGQALALAEKSVGVSDPNPRVGCVIGLPDGTVLATGWTQQVGSAHAESMALAAATATGTDLTGATAWVTLEPCAHHGRTPPCADALVDAGIARVVVAAVDPFHRVAGAGIARLRAAGVIVDFADPPIAALARELNIGFFSRMERGLPWVRLKVASTLDGRTALRNGQSKWITGAEARADGHSWRRRASFVVTGIGTVLSDDPRLDVRLVPTTVQPQRVVLDSRLRTPASARVVTEKGVCIIATANADPGAAHELRSAGAEVLVLDDGNGRVDVQALMTELGRREANEVHVEAGSILSGHLFEKDCVDELLMYVAPRMIGPGIGVANLVQRTRLQDAIEFEYVDVARVGPDVRVRARRPGHL